MKSKSPKFAPMVQVTWIDAAFAEFRETHDPTQPAPAPEQIGVVNYTIGYVVRDDGEGMILALDFCEDGKYRHLMEIPRAYIREVKPLRLIKTTSRAKRKDPLFEDVRTSDSSLT